MTELSPRIQREQHTLEAMIVIYCRANHQAHSLCPSCTEIQQYALQRLQKCPHGGDKPTCAHCRIHCYAPDKREAIQRIMRFSGPRMLWRHPWLALRHLLDGQRGQISHSLEQPRKPENK